MSVNLTSHQIKQEHFEEFINLIDKINSHKNELSRIELNKLYDRIHEIRDDDSISSIAYHILIADNIQRLVTNNQGSPYNYDEKNIAQLPFNGNKKYGFNFTGGDGGILQKKDISLIVKHLRTLKIDSKENFVKYFSQLSDEFKNEMFIEIGENETEEEFVYVDLKSFLDFYYECEKNGTWVYIECN